MSRPKTDGGATWTRRWFEAVYLPDLQTGIALIVAIFTVTALISGLWSTPRLYLKDRDVAWNEKRVSLPHG